jgi:hypothetical protein
MQPTNENMIDMKVNNEAISDSRIIARALLIPHKQHLTFREVMMYLDRAKSTTAKFIAENCISKNHFGMYSKKEIDDVLNGFGKIDRQAAKIKL